MKVGAGAETNSFGSTTLTKRLMQLSVIFLLSFPYRLHTVLIIGNKFLHANMKKQKKIADGLCFYKKGSLNCNYAYLTVRVIPV